MQRDAGFGPEGIKGGAPGFFWGTLAGILSFVFLWTVRWGRCSSGCCQPRFVSIEEHTLPVGDKESYSRIVDVSRLRTFSFVVRNEGTHSAVVWPELSPDGTTWSSFGELPQLIKPGDRHIFVLQYYLRYARLKFRIFRPGFETALTIWFQGQG